MADSIEKETIGNQSASKRTGLFDHNKRYEQIGNTTFIMRIPSVFHEAIVVELIGQFGNYLDGKPCRVFGSNLGLDLKDFIPAIKEMPTFRSYFKKNIEKGKEGEVYLLPDVSVLCNIDKTKFGSHGYSGIPRMLIEVASPSTNVIDFDEKRSLYEAIGVGEYWIISDTQNVAVYVLQDGKFVKTIHQTEENILEVPVSVFPDLVIKFDKNKIELP